ncbi:hypothetical protein BsWGS_10084 [Bradybaena similaris]
MRSKIVAEQSGAYRSTTSSMAMEAVAVTPAVACYQAQMLQERFSVSSVLNLESIWHEWEPRADELASIVPVAGLLMIDKRDIFQKIWERMLVDDTSTTESVGTRMREFGIHCGSGRRVVWEGRFGRGRFGGVFWRGRFGGRIRGFYNHRVTRKIIIYTLRYLLK